ncbi:MAG: cytochrome c biogenesis heme-transporting ATPase CcmA [Steroidobacteraceae bacterium]
MPDGALLEARSINAWRGDRHILKDVSFTVRAGEFLKITGPNGVGKTTLLRVVCGLLPAESGQIHWCGRPVGGARDEFHAQLGYLGHPNSLKADLTARENLRFLAGLRQDLTPRDVDGALERVGILSRGDLPARSLSAGQKRRLALARLLLAEASLWVLDEPVTNLDAAGISLVEELVQDHVGQGGLALAAVHQKLLDGSPHLRRLELG